MAPPPGLQVRGTSRRRLKDVRAFVQAYDTDLQLLSNSCWTFADALVDYLLAEPGA
jgi:hypothetical protein